MGAGSGAGGVWGMRDQAPGDGGGLADQVNGLQGYVWGAERHALVQRHPLASRERQGPR